MRTCKIFGAVMLLVLSIAVAAVFADAAPGANPLLPADIRSVSVIVASAGRSIANVSVDGEDSLVAVPSNDAKAGTTMTFSEVKSKSDGPVKSFTLSFNRDVTFSGYPSFRVSVPQSSVDGAASHKFLLVFEDGDTSVAFREDSFSFGSLQFIGGFFTAFHARANHTYRARVTIASPSSAGSTLLQGSHAGCLQSDGAVTGCLELGKANVDRDSELTLRDEAPQNMAALSGAHVRAEPLYLSARGSAFTSTDATLSLVVPLTSAFSPLRYNLAWYDDVVGGSWHTSLAQSVDRDGDVIRLRFHFPDKASNDHTIVLALYDESVDDSGARSTHAPVVAVLGDSISVLTVMPQNALGCIASNDAPGHCHYSSDATLNYPGVVSQLTGARVSNLALMNASQTTVDRGSGNDIVKSWIHSSVLQIPPESDVVVVEAGIADIYQNHEDPTTSLRLPILVEAIVSRAPRAKIVFLGLRCCGAGNEAWNSEEKTLAVRYGVYVDRYDAETKSVSFNTPDGIHCSPEYSRAVGESVVSAMKSMGL